MTKEEALNQVANMLYYCHKDLCPDPRKCPSCEATEDNIADNSMENTQTETYNMNVNDLDFIMTCGACPEQYDVFYDKKQVAYIRLRWGYLTVYCPDYGGTCVYESNAGADSWSGCFKDEVEREEHMKKIRQAIVDYYNESEFS